MDEEPQLRSDNEERAERIMDAAAALMIRYGYDKTTMSDIAREAGVSKGALYLHWSSKEKLFEAMLWRESWKYIDATIARTETDPDGGTLTGLFRNSIVELKNNPVMLAVYRKDRRVLGMLRVGGDSNIFADKFTIGFDFIKMFQEVNAVRKDMDPAVMSYLMAMLSYGFIMIEEVIPTESAPPVEDVLQGMSEIFERAFAPEGGGDSEAGKRVVRRVVEQYRQLQNARNRNEASPL